MLCVHSRWRTADILCSVVRTLSQSQRILRHCSNGMYTAVRSASRVSRRRMFLLGDACEERQFLNSTSGACQQCTRCGQLGLQPVQACNATNDAVCERCPNPNEYYAIALMGCTLDCALCPRGCPKGKEGECDCSFDKCLTGIMCDVNTCTPDPPTTETPSITSPTTTSPPTQPVVLPHWGIALVSIGVILGIVLFSALFVLLGLFTSRRRGQHDDFNSNSSSNMKCGSLADRLSYSNGGTSSSLISLYTQSNSPAFQNYQLSLKQGSSHSNFGSWNNIKCSPKTQRSSSVTMTKPRDGFLTPV